MKKDTLRVILVAAIVFVLYNLIVFLLPFVKTLSFWITWVFSIGGFAVVCAAIYIAFVKNPDAKSRFYGFPIARIGLIYGLVQLIVSILFMALSVWVPVWLVVIISALCMGVALIGLIAAEATMDEIQHQDVKLKRDVYMMRSLQSKVNQIASMCDNLECAASVRAFAEEVRYSDPVSSPAVAGAEADLAAMIDALQNAVADGDSAAAMQLCRRANVLLAERNRLCKLNKSY